MSEDAVDTTITTDVSVITGQGGEAIVQQVYLPPLDGKSDDYEGFDMQCAKGIGELLNKHYFGYRWKSYADTKQGIVGFSIPELMGETLHMVINLKQFSDLTPQLIVEKAGELLERMHLPRGKFDMAALVAARSNRANFHFDDKRIQ